MLSVGLSLKLNTVMKHVAAMKADKIILHCTYMTSLDSDSRQPQFHFEVHLLYMDPRRL